MELKLVSDDSQRTEPLLAPNSLDTPTLDKCPNKELGVTIINDTEYTIYKFTNSTTELLN